MTAAVDFDRLDSQFIPEINSQVQLFRHRRTRAELLSISNDDENKVFGVTFRTPPPDSSGLAHIMEHSVLCGSRKYPVKEPFVELRKGSLNTFLNAMTYPDKTTYPVASQNLQDFYNLVDVYLDAVFFPLLPPHIFDQEGWHYELNQDGQGLIYKGVVINEMKGVYSDPDNLLGRKIQQTLFPDNAYGFDSGGDPEAIPNLTYADFKAFHAQYYHPSNARFYFYGDDPPGTRFEILDGVLREFSPLKIDSRIANQRIMAAPKAFSFPYAVSDGEAGDKKCMFAVNWLLPENRDPVQVLTFRILNHILIGTPASPLRKALLDSGYGEDLAGRGLADYLRQMTFSTGLKGVAEEDAGKVEALILSTLGELAGQGIDLETIAAAVNTIEFRFREQNTGSFPRGLFLMLLAMNVWLHDGDPLGMLAFNAPFQEIKTRLNDGERLFETLVEQYFLKNGHRTTVLLKPDPALRVRREQAEKGRLAQVHADLTAAEIEAIVENARRLQEIQATPDPPMVLATIPSLIVDDLDRENKQVPLAVEHFTGTEVLFHDLFTNGVFYLDLGFNLHTLPQDLLPYAPLFGRALTEMGTENEDYVRLSQRIGRDTGGIWTSTMTSATKRSAAGAAWLLLRGKATTAQAGALLGILQDILVGVRVDDRERFRQIVLEEKSGLESRLIPGGHGMINRRLRARFNTADWAAEQMSGISHLNFLRALAEKIETDWQSVHADLARVRDLLVNRLGMVCNVTLDAQSWKDQRISLEAFLEVLPEKPFVQQVWTKAVYPPGEGLSISAQVNYVGKGASLYDLGYKLHGSIHVILNHLRTSWLWEKVRVQGGAYGGMCSFDRHSGVFTFLSYRDPNLAATLDNFDATAGYLRKLEISQSELDRSIIGAIGAMDAYRLPDAKGYISLIRHLLQDTDRERQRIREEVLSTTPADFLAFADTLDKLADYGQVAVLGSAEALAAANLARGDFLEIRKVL